jgi:hypothetical protein
VNRFAVGTLCQLSRRARRTTFQQSKEKRNIEVMWCAKFQQSKPIQSQTLGRLAAGYCTKIVLALLSGAGCFNLLRADSAGVGNLLALPLEQRFQGAKITAPEPIWRARLVGLSPPGSDPVTGHVVGDVGT